LCRFVKSELRSKYYDVLSVFRKRIDSMLESTSNKNSGKGLQAYQEKVQFFDRLCPVCENTFTAVNQQGKIAA